MTATLPPKARGVQPVEPHEVVEAVAAMLRASDDFVRQIGGGDAEAGRVRLHTHRLPLRDDDGGEADAAPMWCLVKQPDRMAGAWKARRGVAGERTVSVLVQVSADPNAMTRPESRVSRAQVIAEDVLDGEPLDVTRGTGRFVTAKPLEQTGAPNTPFQDPRAGSDGRLYSVSVYDAFVSPEAIPAPPAAPLP